MTLEFKKFLPDGWDKAPETPLDALRCARDLLSDEQKWVQGDWFQNAHPEHDPEDPFCNSWKVCAAGAIGAVTIGMSRDPELSELFWDFREVLGSDTELYTEACALLTDELSDNWDWDSIPEFNDYDETTYADVVSAFDRAIEAQRESN